MPAAHRPGRVPIPRRLRRTRPDEASAGPTAAASASLAASEPAVAPVVVPGGDLELALTRPEVDALVRAISPEAAAEHAWTVTPDRLRMAIERALGPDLADGWVLVTRLPRALHSTESWHVRLSGVTMAGRERIAGAVRTARLASTPSAHETGDVR